MTAAATVVLYRPVGQQKLDLVRDAAWRRFPPRLFWQPIFYPVTTEDYAVRIARDWNVKDPNSGYVGYVGYVLRFNVSRDYLDRHQPQTAGGRDLMEYWIPAEELEQFNDAIVGEIEVVREFRADHEPPA